MNDFFFVVGFSFSLLLLFLFLSFFFYVIRDWWQERQSKKALEVGIDRILRFALAWKEASEEQKQEHIEWCNKCIK